MLWCMVGGTVVDAEELVNQVDWKEPVQSADNETTTISSVVSAPDPRDPKLGDMKLTPEQKEHVQRLKKGFVECQVQRYNGGRPRRPDDDDDQFTKQRDKIQQQDEQNVFEGIVASRTLGKQGAWPKGQTIEDPYQDFWESSHDEKHKLAQALKTKDSKIASLEIEMRRMQKDIEELHKVKATQPTPQRQTIATPDAPDNRQNIIIMLAGIIHRRTQIPDTNSSGDSSNDNNGNNELYRVVNGNDGGDIGGGGDFGGDGHGDNASVGGDSHGRNGERREFIVVKASNSVVPTVAGNNFAANPYLQFYKSMRGLIYNQGEDRGNIVGLFTELEEAGASTIIKTQHKEMVQTYPRAAQCNRAILSALLNYTAGIARGMVEYGVENGLGAWRRLYHHYMPLADDVQHLFIQQLYVIIPVTENNIDGLFNKAETITELYASHGKAEDHMSEKWLKAAVTRNLPKHIVKDLAIQLKDAQTIKEVRHIVDIYMHDYQTGMPRGQTGPMLCITSIEQPDSNTEAASTDNGKEQEPSIKTNKEDASYAITKAKASKQTDKLN